MLLSILLVVSELVGEKAERLKFVKRPNVVLIVADDYGFNDIGYHQDVIKTPNLDGISAKGVRLENYYVQPICTPSRSQLMSGRYQIHTGLQHQLIWRGLPSGLPLDTELLPEALSNCGYDTMAVGKWHLGYAKSAQTPWGRGFHRFTGYLGGSEDYYKKTSCANKHNCGVDMATEDGKGDRTYTDSRQNYSAFEYVDTAKEYLTSRDTEKPFFLYLPLQSVHMPLQAPAEYIERYEKTIKDHTRRTYAGMVSVLDEAVGNVTDFLKSRDLWADTVFIFSTDNGGQAYAGGNNLPFRGNKGGYWEGGIHGVGFVAGGYFESRRHSDSPPVSHELVHISDWFPTIMEATSCAPSSNAPALDGMSQWDTLTGKGKSPRVEILHNIDPMSETDGTDNRTFAVEYDISKQSALRHGKWKILTGDPGYPDFPIQIPPQAPPNVGESESADLTVLTELPTAWIPPRPKPLTRLVRLFNIEEDPLERNEVSDSFPDVVTFLLTRLQFYNSTQVPVNFPPVDKRSFPKYHDGFWKPWLG